MPDQPPQPQKPNWLDDLAKRSTGLPENESSSRPISAGDQSLWKLAGLGLQFAVTVVLFALIGREADRRFGWSPWGLISFVLVAVVGNLYLLIKEGMREDKSGSSKTPGKKL